MSDLIRLVVDLLTWCCPFVVVWEWERGLLFRNGRFRRILPPGLYLICPGINSIKKVSMAHNPERTGKNDVVLRDQSVLTYVASLTVAVINAERAYIRLDHHSDSVTDIAARVLSERLADVDPDRFDPAYNVRARLLEELRKAINDELAEYGLNIVRLGFESFVRGVRTFRVLLDRIPSHMANVAPPV